MTKLTYEIIMKDFYPEEMEILLDNPYFKEYPKHEYWLHSFFYNFCYYNAYEDEYKDCVGFAIFYEAMRSLMCNLVRRGILVNHIISISKRSVEYLNDKDAWLKFITKHEKKACREVTKNVILSRRVYTTMFFESLCREFRDSSRAQILDENWFPDLTAAHIQRMNERMGFTS